MGTSMNASDITSVFDAITPESQRARGTIKWSNFADDVLAAWIAEMDFPSAPAVREAIHEVAARDTTGYPLHDLDTGLPQACAAWLYRHLNVSVDPAQIHLLPDILRGIEIGIQEFSAEGTPVAVMTPAYPPFFEAVRESKRPILEIPMLMEGGRLVPDFTGIAAALAAGAQTFILCNPHNPTGRVFTREELVRLAEIVEQHSARVIADEVHAPLVYPGQTFTSYSTVSDAARRHSITLTSASKGWNIAGLKSAQVILTNPDDETIWSRVAYLRTHGASTVGIAANRAALEKGEDWLREVVAYLDSNRRLLRDLLERDLPEVGYVMPEGTYLAWLDFRPLGLENPAAFFLEHARVAVNEGSAFGAPGAGHVRLNFATSRSILTEIVHRMASAVQARDA